MIYIGSDRRVVGTAQVTGNEIIGYVDEVKGEMLAELVGRNLVAGVSCSFSIVDPAALPFMKQDMKLQRREYELDDNTDYRHSRHVIPINRNKTAPE